jgi:DNA-binding GntR family transcriptional regulator
MAALDPQLQERIYVLLKADYLAGVMPPGEKLDLQMLSDRFKTSKTPVREAACRLMGEGLLDRHGEGGFMVTRYSAREQAQLYAWSAHVLSGLVQVLKTCAIRQVLGGVLQDPRPTNKVEVAQRTGLFFERLAGATGNDRAVVTVAAINAQTHYLRIMDSMTFADATRELQGLFNPAVSDLQKALRRRIAAYHTRRITACSA